MLGLVGCSDSSTLKVDPNKVYSDTLKLVSVYNSNPFPKETVEYDFKELQGFVLNSDYKIYQLQQVELITNQIEFEKVASIPRDSVFEMPYIDFNDHCLLAIITDNVKAELRGGEEYYKPIGVHFSAKNCERNNEKIKFNFKLFELNDNDRVEKQELYLIQIYTKDAKSILAQNLNGLGRHFSLEINK